ncbi:BgTH12-00014 [Blumeria graminis f. sp. triticale]|uniref:Bgt-3436 n=3 Tax=Blumeria graminis TaxID=34373 RepID=A0A381LB59_BLUGR|nr:chaperone for assembly of alpha and beta subunits into F1 sector of mitochondrial F1F0 ATP synthase [Blumeria graminis f. sp. tritici 96224]CAD6504504.1 BgTH12-00014 [Blumeria graminis f. sp. triticale]VDB92425.1 Bgt-3436 [Blumeria graminis f. sp. tritici]
MAGLAFLKPRCGTPSVLNCLENVQRRWAQVHDTRFRFLATQGDSFLDRYKEKLARKAQLEGIENLKELREAYKEKINALRNKATAGILSEPKSSPSLDSIDSNLPLESSPSAASKVLGSSSCSSKTGIRTLSSYINIEKARLLPLKELESIWRLRHAHNAQSLCGVIPLSLYNTIQNTAKKNPQFILPVPREGKGAEIHFMQWTFPEENISTVIFTQLCEYKLKGEFSQPHTTITHHLEMSEEKGVVLLRGEIVSGRGVSVDEAKWLLLCLQRFYGGLGDSEVAAKRKRLVEMFGRGDGEFRVEDLVEEAEKLI